MCLSPWCAVLDCLLDKLDDLAELFPSLSVSPAEAAPGPAPAAFIVEEVHCWMGCCAARMAEAVSCNDDMEKDHSLPSLLVPLALPLPSRPAPCLCDSFCAGEACEGEEVDEVEEAGCTEAGEWWLPFGASKSDADIVQAASLRREKGTKDRPVERPKKKARGACLFCFEL